MKGYHESIEYDIHHSTYGKYLQSHYDIKEEIYRSDMSHIFIIYNQQGQKLLLKAINLRENISFDIDTAMKLKHPGIASIHEYGFSDQYMFLVKDYIEGIDLETFIGQQGTLTSANAKTIIKKVATILKYLHNYDKQSIIYRDLKPSNIMITPDYDVFLIDIITLRTVKEQNTDTFYVATKGFSAPEQYGYSQSTETADIYSLGATLFYMLTSRIPDNAKTIKKQLQEANNFTDTNYTIIKKAMQFNPSKRYINVDSMMKDYNRNYKLIKRLSLITLTSLLIILLLAGWVYQSTIFDVTSIQTPKDISIDDLIEMTAGLTLDLQKDNVMHISFDRLLMEESLQSFKYITVGSSNGAYKKEDLSNDIFYGLTEGYGFMEYFRSGVYSELDNRNNLSLVIYNKDKKPLAYYILNDIDLYQHKNTISYLSYEDVTTDHITEITSGIDISIINSSQVNTSIDKSIINPNLKDFDYISVWSSETAFHFPDIQKQIYGAVIQNSGMFSYASHGYDSNIEGRPNLLVLLFSKTKEPIGYYIYNNVLDGYQTSETEEIIIDMPAEEYQVANGILINYDDNSATVTIDKTLVGDFTYISLWGSESDLPQSTIDWIRNAVGEDNGVYDYDDHNGFVTGYGTVGSFVKQSWILYLLDQDKQILSEHFIYRTNH